MYGYPCAYCRGTVQPRAITREAFKHKQGFVILEHLVIGICDTCGNRYYTCIPHIVVRVCVATFVKTYHLATLAL
jgi:YgiT-type zinc finger domain-containing protein